MSDWPDDLGDFTLAHFDSLCGRVFTVSDGDGVVELELIEVSALSRPPKGTEPPPRPFALMFQGPAEPLVDQKVIDLDHDETPLRGVFLLPVGLKRGAMRYQAVFH